MKGCKSFNPKIRPSYIGIIGTGVANKNSAVQTRKYSWMR
jgi:hypothetical protein